MGKGDHDRAIADFTRVIEMYPSGDFAYQRRAWAYFKAGAGTAGRGTFAAIASRQGRRPEYAWAHPEALVDFRRALSRHPSLKASAEGLKRLGAAP